LPAGKAHSINQLRFKAGLEGNLVALYRDLASGDYKIGRSIAFVVTYLKIREVWAAEFRDRVVHHLIYNAISDRFSPVLHPRLLCLHTRTRHA
jgi:RNA-directed DNA polymerase